MQIPLKADMIIRKMTVRDVPGVYTIECGSFASPWREEDFYIAVNPDYPYYRSLVCEDGRTGTLVGFVIFSLICGEGEIMDLASGRDHRGEGIATALMSRCIDDIRNSGGTRLYLEVRESNSPARRLYEKLGFEEYGIRRGYYKMPCEDAILMQKSL